MNRTERWSRRRVLRATLGGTAVTLGLPLLDCFLNTNGTALANGAPLPVRFGIWHWGLGNQPGRWAPQDAGPLKQLGPELAPLERLKDKINVVSGLKVMVEATPVPVHAGHMALLTGVVPGEGRAAAVPTIDSLVADGIGTTTRFKSLEASGVAVGSGTPFGNISFGARGAAKPPEVSPAGLYTRIFGPDFRDPNQADFKPDPLLMASQSVLSAMGEQRTSLFKAVGATDRARLDEYFTSFRQLEHQVALRLQKPAPLQACSLPQGTQDQGRGSEVNAVLDTNRIMAGLLAHAFACDQTRVFSYVFTPGIANIHFAGDPSTYHSHTHEDRVDEKLGYQVGVSKLAMESMKGFASFIDAFDSIKEGDGTLLDRTLLLAVTDTSNARLHEVENIPVYTAGKAGGAMRTGLHVIAHQDPITRASLTAMRAMKLPVGSFGTGSIQTSRALSELLV